MEFGHQQCQGRRVFAVYLWTPRNVPLMESVISSIKDDTSSQFISGLHGNDAFMESVTSSIKDDTSSQFISGLLETKLGWSRSPAVSKTVRLRSFSLDSK